MCDIVIDGYEKLRKDGFTNIIDIFAIIIDSLYFCYIKFLMEKNINTLLECWINFRINFSYFCNVNFNLCSYG
jgi:hypothetical protein